MTKSPSKVQMDLARLGSRFTRFLLVIAAILLVLEFIVHRHGETHIEESFMFPAIYGFIAFVFIVEVGKLLRRLIMRDEHYYADEEDAEGDHHVRKSAARPYHVAWCLCSAIHTPCFAPAMDAGDDWSVCMGFIHGRGYPCDLACDGL